MKAAFWRVCSSKMKGRTKKQKTKKKKQIFFNGVWVSGTRELKKRMNFSLKKGGEEIILTSMNKAVKLKVEELTV